MLYYMKYRNKHIIYEFESQWERIREGCKTSNDVRSRDMASEESTRKEVGCGGNEDVEMDEWSQQAGKN